ncbi:MAG: trehalase family glycosidase, partial [Bdellovibrionota bacterium]
MTLRMALTLTLIFAFAPISSETADQRGMYFDKKVYVPEPLPTFEKSRKLLPEPILDSRPELVDLYWAAWKIGFSHIQKPEPKSPFVSNYMDAAFSSHIFQWDTIFITRFAVYGQRAFNAIQSLDNFYCRQRQDGYISREIVKSNGADYVYVDKKHTVNPPLFAWAEVVYSEQTGDTKRFASVYRPLVKYAEWLEIGRRSHGAVHGLYWNTGLGSGMDNTPRKGSGWIDMSSQMVMMYRSLAEIARSLGRATEAQRYDARATDITARIQRFMWDDSDGLFYDVDDSGHFAKKKTLASFWPLLAGVATDKQAERAIVHLSDPKEFWRRHTWPSLAADEPEYSSDGHYWKGGVWAPTNAMVVEGLRRYPSVQGAWWLARLGAEKHLANLSEVHRKTGTIWEFYKPDSAEPGKIWWFLEARKDFVGWSGLGPIQFLIEETLGFRVDAKTRRVIWVVEEKGRHGIKRLPVGQATLDLIARAQAPGSALEVEVGFAPGPDGRSVTLDILW